ncbi:Fatty acid synthase subunit alpha [Lachancea thermotolerans]
MSPENQDELCHVLLTELLAYQFAWPVRWVETQEVLLNERQTERYIEIGPQPILANMAKRTLKQNENYENATTISTRREVFSVAGDMDKICYRYDPPAQSVEKTDAPEENAQEKINDGTEIPRAQEISTSCNSSGATSGRSFSTQPELTTELVVQSVVANKIAGYSIETLPLSHTLKELCKGKSTLQNEIKGDLYKELPGLQDAQLEDMSLESICKEVESPKTLGPVTLGEVTKFIPRKFAGKLGTVSAVKEYLSRSWGVNNSAPLLLFIASRDLKTRFSSEEETQQFIDNSCVEFAKFKKIDYSLESAKTNDVGAGCSAEADEKPKTVDIEVYNEFNSDLMQLQKEQHNVMGQHLKVTDAQCEIEILKSKLEAMEGKLSAIGEEFGLDYIEKSLTRSFSPLKIRVYDSAWNWGKQSVLQLLHAALLNPQKAVEILSPNEIHNLVNRADLSIIKIIQHKLETEPFSLPVKRRFEGIIQACLRDISSHPVYSATQFTSYEPLGSEHATMQHVRSYDPSQYIKEMSVGTTKSSAETSIVSTKLDSDMSSYYKIEKELFQVYSKIIQYSLASNNSPHNIRAQFETIYEQLLIFLRNSDHVASFFRGIINEAVFSVNKSLITTKDDEQDIIVSDCEISSSDDEDDAPPQPVRQTHQPNVSIPTGVVPFLHLKRRSHVSGEWIYDKALTQMYLNNLLRIGKAGVSFSDKRALILVSDAKDNLSLEVINALLQAGTVVVVATQRYDHETTSAFQKSYQKYGASGSKLIVLPLNISSKIDVFRFSEYLFSNIGDIDFLLPMNVKATPGSILDYSSEAELTHRSSSVNLLRLLGCFVKEKRVHAMETRPTHVLLPLSPNHANIYEESNFKDTFLALVLQKWYDEDWSTELSICGCVYGWTNDDGGDLVARGLEKMGVRTFANNEMALNMLGLLSYNVVECSQESPLIADLNGGLQTLPNISSVVSKLQKEMATSVEIREEIEEQARITRELRGVKEPEVQFVEPKGNVRSDFPQMLPYHEVRAKFNGEQLSGLLDLSQVVVVTGFAEIGPWGSARTRWEMEKSGEFSLEGCIELACVMGLIEYQSSAERSGWVDCKSGLPVEEVDIKQRYEAQILEHTGIRIIEPELFQGYDPKRKQLLHEVIITHDLSPIQMDAASAQQYKLQHGELVEVYPIAETGNSECHVKFLKGCSLMIPKALRLDRFVAGQVPTGWDPARYGIGEDITSQVDQVTLYALIATAEALISSGITDPYEMYQYVHVSEVGNCSGSGIGGMNSLRAMRQERLKDTDVQNDIIQETFVNASAAWVNMLLLSSSGPIKTPVGACATALESLDNAVETIRSGQAKVCIAGGYDDLEGHVSHEFGNMGATVNSDKELQSGRDPREMCRPATSTRAGFLEAHGAGIQVLMSAEVAIEMGVPIYGIVAMTSTASDKIGRSLPAPGKGILTCARQQPRARSARSAKLDARYRKRQLQARLREIDDWAQNELAAGAPDVGPAEARLVQQLAHRQAADAKKHWGNYFWHDDPRVSPLQGALATFGLTVDDLTVASCHGTSTKANELNESQILDTIMQHLGRTPGNPLLAVFQKHLTGHPKGAAGAWMANGLLQLMQDRVVPGNRNADNIDQGFRRFEHLLYPSENIRVADVKASCLTSFGFGQKGAMAVLLNANYVLAALSESEYTHYAARVRAREARAQRRLADALVHHTTCRFKDQAPFSAAHEEAVYLDPLARADDELRVRPLRDQARGPA